MSSPDLPNPKRAWFSSQLGEKIRLGLFAPLTLIEAPTGYGKTAALMYLKEQSEGQAQVFVLSFILEDKKSAWARFCHIISKIDPKAAEHLLALGPPKRTNASKVAQAFSMVTCEQETLLILDNFQIWQNGLSPSILQALLNPVCPRLHLVISTQYLKNPSSLEGSLDRVHRISAFDLDSVDTR